MLAHCDLADITVGSTGLNRTHGTVVFGNTPYSVVHHNAFHQFNLVTPPVLKSPEVDGLRVAVGGGIRVNHAERIGLPGSF